jgi:predicted nucleotidyltransferase
MVPSVLAAFGSQVAERLVERLKDGLVGGYFVGSIALGGFVLGESDLDLLAVVEPKIIRPDKRFAT